MPEHEDIEAALTVPEADAERLIRMLKRHLSGTRTCDECGYDAPITQWGFRTTPIPDSADVVVSACCPSCERSVRLRSAGTSADDERRGSDS